MSAPYAVGGCARDQSTTQFCGEAVAAHRRVAELEAALGVALTALCSWQSYMEATSDFMSVPSRETASRLYDQCSDAIAACDSVGIKPNLSSEPK